MHTKSRDNGSANAQQHDEAVESVYTGLVDRTLHVVQKLLVNTCPVECAC